jgi:hypothetical protein
MRLLKLLLVLLVWAAVWPAFAGPYEDGLATYKRGDYATALRLWRPLADAGDADAQLNFGFMYANGEGVPQDYSMAVSWFSKAAEQRHAGAQYNLGIMYEQGWGVPQDYIQAHVWFKLAASRSDASDKELSEKAINSRDRIAARMTPAQIARRCRLPPRQLRYQHLNVSFIPVATGGTAMLMPAFQEWPDEAAIVGRLLVDYGELEFELALSMGWAISDKRQGIRDFFSARGERRRIELADEKAGVWMRLTGVKDEFAETLAAMRACKDIRNGFAHCHWASLKHGLESDGLFFVNIEQAAGSPGKFIFQWQHASLPRLQAMEAYYTYTHGCLLHVLAAISAQRGQPYLGVRPMPTKKQPPPPTIPASSASAALLPADF